MEKKCIDTLLIAPLVYSIDNPMIRRKTYTLLKHVAAETPGGWLVLDLPWRDKYLRKLEEINKETMKKYGKKIVIFIKTCMDPQDYITLLLHVKEKLEKQLEKTQKTITSQPPMTKRWIDRKVKKYFNTVEMIEIIEKTIKTLTSQH